MEIPSLDNLFSQFHEVKVLYTSSASPTTVYLYEDSGCNKLILKKLEKSKILSSQQLESAVREMQIHSSLRHPNIVQLYDYRETPSEFYLLMEFISRHDYFTERIEVVRSKQNNKPFNMKPDGNIEKLRSFSFDILSGLEYMHSNGFIHMDLKPANLMVRPEVSSNEYPLVKIADFGLSRKIDSEGLCIIEKKCGTDKYIAPEVKDGARVSCVSDMWAFGLILHLLTVGYLPFALKWAPGQPLKFMPRHWKKYEQTKLTDLIQSCLQVNPEQRISSTEAICHEWFSCEV
jgi:serine/threonine protein kinase